MLTVDLRHSPQCLCSARWWCLWLRPRPRLARRCFVVVLCLSLLMLISMLWPSASWAETGTPTVMNGDASSETILRPAASGPATSLEDSENWLLSNSKDRFTYSRERSWRELLKHGQWSSRPRAALISLVRNEELDGIMQSMRQLEYHWNYKYRYPWIFFNERPFSAAFKVSLTLSAPTES